MPLASVRRRTLLLVLGKDPNLHRRSYDRDPRALVRQRNDIGASRAVGRARDHEVEVDRDRPQLITDVTVVTAITLVEVAEEETVIKIVVRIEGSTGRTEARLLPVFCKCQYLAHWFLFLLLLV